MSQPIRVWDLPVRVFHWSLAISFAVAYTVAESESLRGLHTMLGYTVLGLVVFRLLWGFVGTRYARFSSFAYSPGAALGYLKNLFRGSGPQYIGHNPAGSWAVYLMLVLALATGVSGYLTLNEIGGEAFEEVHELAANAWLAVVIVHVLGVIASSIAHRENLARAMVTGWKQGAGINGIPGATVGIGVVVAIAVISFWSWSFLTGAAPVGPDASVERIALGHDAGDDD
jgi:cytochrome b